MLSDLRVEVRDLARSVSHTQIPAYYDEMLGEYYFAGSAADATDPVDPTPIRTDFYLARSIGTASAFEAILQRNEAQSDEYTVELARQMYYNLTNKSRPHAFDPEWSTDIRNPQIRCGDR